MAYDGSEGGQARTAARHAALTARASRQKSARRRADARHRQRNRLRHFERGVDSMAGDTAEVVTPGIESRLLLGEEWTCRVPG